MNKANVFLLVVVSSLLTYISTATQPAATAGVAQEKWEYAVSKFYEPNVYDGSFTWQFESGKGRLVLGIFGRDQEANDDTFVFAVTDSSGRIPLSRQTQLTSYESSWQRKIIKLHNQLGSEGWEIFQVRTREPGVIDQPTMNWRRRVQ